MVGVFSKNELGLGWVVVRRQSLHAISREGSSSQAAMAVAATAPHQDVVGAGVRVGVAAGDAVVRAAELIWL